jgi:N6-adenosine-specific RNA methylase IME4
MSAPTTTVMATVAEDAVLFLWTTLPHLEEAFRVIAAWGFQYKTNLAWVKDKIGLGYFVRNQHELLVVATRGDIPSPAPAARPPSVITASRREHSRKPDEAYELIERMYPRAAEDRAICPLGSRRLGRAEQSGSGRGHRAGRRSRHSRVSAPCAEGRRIMTAQATATASNE